MANICVIGDYDSICGYQALGLPIYVVNEKETAASVLNDAAEKNDVILITEPLAQALKERLDAYRTKQLPAVIPIPAISGNSGFALDYVKQAVKQAAGSDIVFGE